MGGRGGGGSILGAPTGESPPARRSDGANITRCDAECVSWVNEGGGRVRGGEKRSSRIWFYWSRRISFFFHQRTTCGRSCTHCVTSSGEELNGITRCVGGTRRPTEGNVLSFIETFFCNLIFLHHGPVSCKNGPD